ncbi:MAG: hypothetical protein CUN49_07765 [Candidatus Thermofonsia Clade 1 bacterium]|jgi:hypothetical protein|uniref:SH3 domain-containing protein n=1 Tax=Candidatus Thermofonsia Clade 1 bacterium TaxID=2364210 RepID=A0A2M8PEP7_9CHLR|nr:MAG: hypothetical protein CUN49_07765 [Candidatus Thermofonsia Clade 1 bacterium]
MIIARLSKATAALMILAMLAVSACDLLPCLPQALLAPTPTDAPPDVPLQAWTIYNGYLWSQPDVTLALLNGVAPPDTELMIIFGPTEGYIESGVLGEFYLVRAVGAPLSGWIRAREITLQRR